jgi:hypothetical protein
MNKKVICSGIFLFVLCIFYFYWKSEFQEAIKFLFESNYLWRAYNITVIIIFALHGFFVNSSESYDFKLLKSEMVLFDSIVNMATYIAVGSTALSLLKGIYLQEVFNSTYFINFEKYDLFTMIGVSVVLLWFSITRVWKVAIEVLYYNPQEVKRNW